MMNGMSSSIRETLGNLKKFPKPRTKQRALRISKYYSIKGNCPELIEVI